MALLLTPTERGFYPLFTRAALHITEAAEQLAVLVAADRIDRKTVADQIKPLDAGATTPGQ